MSDDLIAALERLEASKRELVETRERLDESAARLGTSVEKMRFSACEFLPTVLELVERQKPHRIVAPAMEAWLAGRGAAHPKDLDLPSLRELLAHLVATVDQVLKAKTGPAQ